jgi:hypothetical protein
MSISSPEFLTLLRDQVRIEGTRAFAFRFCINAATVSNVVNGHLAPTEAIANALGFVRVTSFVKLKTGQQ